MRPHKRIRSVESCTSSVYSWLSSSALAGILCERICVPVRLVWSAFFAEDRRKKLRPSAPYLCIGALFGRILPGFWSSVLPRRTCYVAFFAMSLNISRTSFICWRYWLVVSSSYFETSEMLFASIWTFSVVCTVSGVFLFIHIFLQADVGALALYSVARSMLRSWKRS